MKGHEKDNPVISACIETKLGLSGPEVRQIIRRLRKAGHPICSGSNGYYWATDADDLQSTINHLRTRAADEVDTANGIDPGQKGGLAALPHGYADVIDKPEVIAMPPLLADIKDWFNYLTSDQCNHIELVMIEKQQPFPSTFKGSISNFSMGLCFGEVRGLCVGVNLPFQEILPRIWKKTILIGRAWRKNKRDSILYVRGKYPDLNLRPTDRCKNDSDGMADAVCIAEYGKTRM
jgi:biotin operon repressor